MVFTQSNEIENILFDLGNVLVTVNWDRALRRLAPRLPLDRARLLRDDRPAFQRLLDEPACALETGQIEFHEFHQRASDILGISLGMEDFHVVWCDIFTMIPEMVTLGERLSEKYATWLASNTSHAHYAWILERFPRVAFYRGAGLSYDLGVMKPSVAYYERLMNRFSLDPRTSVFIDDLPENVRGARRAGLRGIEFTGRAALLAALEGLGVRMP